MYGILGLIFGRKTTKYRFAQSRVNDNKSIYSKKQIKLAELARKLQQHMGFPGNDVFRNILQNNLIIN